MGDHAEDTVKIIAHIEHRECSVERMERYLGNEEQT
jgi:hypothetical protein